MKQLIIFTFAAVCFSLLTATIERATTYNYTDITYHQGGIHEHRTRAPGRTSRENTQGANLNCNRDDGHRTHSENSETFDLHFLWIGAGF